MSAATARLLLLSPATTTVKITPRHVLANSPARLFLPTLRSSSSRIRPVTTCALNTDNVWCLTATKKSQFTDKDGHVQTKSTKIDIYLSRVRVLLGAMLWAICYKNRFSFLIFLLVVASKSRMRMSVKNGDEDVEDEQWFLEGEGQLQIC